MLHAPVVSLDGVTGSGRGELASVSQLDEGDGARERARHAVAGRDDDAPGLEPRRPQVGRGGSTSHVAHTPRSMHRTWYHTAHTSHLRHAERVHISPAPHAHHGSGTSGRATSTRGNVASCSTWRILRCCCFLPNLLAPLLLLLLGQQRGRVGGGNAAALAATIGAFSTSSSSSRLVCSVAPRAGRTPDSHGTHIGRRNNRADGYLSRALADSILGNYWTTEQCGRQIRKGCSLFFLLPFCTNGITSSRRPTSYRHEDLVHLDLIITIIESTIIFYYRY